MESPESHGPKASMVACQNSQGIELHGTPLRLGRYDVVFEVHNPANVLQVSEVLSKFNILLKDSTMYSGRAVIKNLISTGIKLVCEAALEDGWRDIGLPSPSARPPHLRGQFDEYICEWQKLYRVLPEFKLHLADMQSFFTELRLWLDQVALGIPSGSPADVVQIENEIASELAASILPCIDTLFEKFEVIAEPLANEAKPIHRAYMQRLLHPLVLCAPFAHRTFTKPLGYAGDYEMVNMIARNTFEGSSLYAKIVNLWFLRQPPAQAHRNRIAYLSRKLLEETLRLSSIGRPARIFSLACGPAIEVQNFLRDQELSNRAQVTLLDFNQETLDHVTNVLASVNAQSRRRASLQFVKKSVLHILKEASKSVEGGSHGQYDFVYCAGLLDYLPDMICQKLMTICYDWLAPDGLLLATNVEPSNPLRNGMEHLLDWQLIYRSARQLKTLRPAQIAPDNFAVNSDFTGVNLFVEVRKPKDG